MRFLTITALISLCVTLSLNSASAFEVGQQADACVTGQVYNPQTNETKDAHLGCRVEVISQQNTTDGLIRVRPLSTDVQTCQMISIMLKDGAMLPYGSPPTPLDELEGGARSFVGLRNKFRLYEDADLTPIPNSNVSICTKADH